MKQRVEVSARFRLSIQPESPEVLRPKGEGWVLVKARRRGYPFSSPEEVGLWTLWEREGEEKQ